MILKISMMKQMTMIDAAEAAFDEYLAECTADYSELCSVRAQSRK